MLFFVEMILPMKDFNKVHVLIKCSHENARIPSIQNAWELWLATQYLTDETSVSFSELQIGWTEVVLSSVASQKGFNSLSNPTLKSPISLMIFDQTVITISNTLPPCAP